jgi:ankyrin repeat protein
MSASKLGQGAVMSKVLYSSISLLVLTLSPLWAASRDANSQTVNQYKLLEKAALATEFDVVENLLKSGVDPCSKTNFLEVKDGETIPTILKRVILRATDEDKEARYALMLKLFESQKCGSRFDEKAYEKVRKIGEHRIEALADQRKRPDKYVQFRQAIRHGKIEEVRQYLQQGFYPDAPAAGENKENAIFVAVQHGYVEILKELIRHVPDVDVENEQGWTPLWIAVAANPVKAENLKVVELLLADGADINHRNRNGALPIMSAFAGQSVDMLKLILSHRPLLNVTDDRGISPLAWQVGHWNNVEAVRLYLQAGADPNLKAPPVSKSALDIAREMNNAQILKALQDRSN